MKGEMKMPDRLDAPSKNKLTSFIKRKGEYLGSGCERAAYDYKGKVYKVPYESNEQGYFEQDIMEMLPERFKTFFPNPKFYGRICEMDYVTVAREAEWNNEIEERCQKMSESINMNFEYGLYEFVYLHGVKLDVDLFEELLDWMVDQGGAVDDILDNDGNYGYDPTTMELKIVDWGWSSSYW